MNNEMTNQITKVKYGDMELNITENPTLEDLKLAMIENFPELEDAEAIQDGTTVIFKPRAGTKGSSDEITKVKYGDMELNITENPTIEDLKLAMIENFPELEDAEAVQEGSTVTFKPRAGTKGI